MVHHRWHRVNQFLSQARNGEKYEEQSFEKYCRQCKLPRVAHEQHNGIGKEGIEPHARCQHKRQFGINSHDESSDDSRQGRSGEQCAIVHARFCQDSRVHGQDVSQGEKGGESTDNFFFNRHGLRVEAKQTMQP